jgi:hypothetical protein
LVWGKRVTSAPYKEPGIDKANKKANVNDYAGDDGLLPDLSHYSNTSFKVERFMLRVR